MWAFVCVAVWFVVSTSSLCARYVRIVFCIAVGRLFSLSVGLLSAGLLVGGLLG